MTAPLNPSIVDSPSDTLADLRRHLELYPEVLIVEIASSARVLRRLEAEAEAAREWLVQDGLEVRA
jgi:hypothetical protein